MDFKKFVGDLAARCRKLIEQTPAVDIDAVREAGRQAGYEAGHAEGYDAGYNKGYDEGDLAPKLYPLVSSLLAV